MSELKAGRKVVGVKQTRRALGDGKAARVFVAEDADPRVVEPGRFFKTVGRVL